MDRNAETTAHNYSDRIARTAWFCAFVLPLTLAVLLLGVKSAQAASPTPAATPLAFEEELFEGEEELGLEDEAEFAQEECEIAEEEAAEGEISAAEAKAICREAEEAIAEAKAGPSSTGPAQCALRSAHAHASIHHDKLKLTIGYTSSSPTPATIEVRSGAQRIAFAHRHLGKTGVLRITKKLRKPIERVTVSFKTPSCGSLRTKSTKVH